MTSFTPWSSLLGGVLIGASASFLLLGNGRVAGISGIVGGLVPPARQDIVWRALFIAGLIAGGVAMTGLRPASFEESPSPWPLVVSAGLFVGFGTRLGNGCTSGHGVCGLSRLSLRSFVATLTFMGAGIVMTFLLRHAWR